MIDHLISCPSCGSNLQPHVGDPDSTPWLCNVCNLGFWTCELQGDARKTYRPQHKDFGFGNTSSIKIARAHELEVAGIRGTSAREDQLSLLTPAQLTTLLGRKKLDPRLRKLVQDEQARRQQPHGRAS